MSTVEKALSLLNYFSADEPEIGLSRLQRLSGFDKGTVYRHLQSLKNGEWLEQDPVSKAYRIGPMVQRLASIRAKTSPLEQIVNSHVLQLADSIGELVHAGRLQEDAITTICFKDGGKGGTRVGFDATEKLPLHATSSGIAMLAFGSPDFDIEDSDARFEHYTTHTPANRVALLKLIMQTRRNGYANANQTYELDVCSIAVPFYGSEEYALGTIAIATPASRMTAIKKKEFVTQAQATADAISNELGSSSITSYKQKNNQRELA